MSSSAEFTGRREILARIGRWCTGSSPRPLILIGPPGSGKTTVVGRLDEITKAKASGPPGLDRGSLAYIHFCRADDDRSLNPIRFIESLAGALADRYPGFRDAVLAEAPEVQINAHQSVGSAVGSDIRNIVITELVLGERSSRIAYDRAVRRPLERLRQAGRSEPVRVVIDALDESLTFDRQRHLVDLLRHALDTAGLPSENLRFLVTTRRGERRVLDVLGGEVIDLVSDVDTDDVKEYVQEQVTLRCTGLSAHRVKQLIAAVTEASRGNFLYAYHATAQLDPHSEPYRLPDGLRGLYADFLKRELRPDGLDPAWLERHWPVLSTLAVARSPGLTPDQLSGATHLDPGTVRRTLNICGQFLDAREAPGGQQAGRPVGFYHPSFREFLLEDEDLSIADQRPDRRLAEFLFEEYEAAPDDPANRYGIEHLHRHLSSAIAAERNAAERAACRAMLGRAVDDVGLLERKTVLVGADAVAADIALAADQDESIRPQVAAVTMIAGHVRSWRADHEPNLFAQQMLDAALRTGAHRLAAAARDQLVRLGTPYLVRRWESGQDSPELVRRLIGHHWGVAALAALPGDRIASASYDETVRVWNHRDGSVLKVIRLRGADSSWSRTPPAIAGTPDGRLAVGFTGQNELLLVEPDSGNIERRLPDLAIQALMPAADDLLLGAVGATIRAWRYPDIEPRPDAYSGHTAQVRALLSGSGGSVFSADQNGEVHRWRLPDAGHGRRVMQTPTAVHAIAASERLIMAGCDDGDIWVSDLDGNGPRILRGHRGPVRALLLICIPPPDGRPTGVEVLLSASDDATIRVWEVASGTCTRILVGHEGMVQSLADLGDGLVASAESQDLVLIWKLSSAAAASDETSGGAVRGLAVAPHRVVAGYEDGATRLWRLDTGALETQLAGHAGPVRGVAVGTDGRPVSGGEDSKVFIWAATGTALERVVNLEHGEISRLVGAADGRVIVATEHGVYAVEPETGAVTSLILGFPPVYELTSSPTGWIAVGEDRGRQRLYNVLTGQARYMRRGSDGFYLNSVHSMAITGDGRLVSDGGEMTDPVGSLFVYDIESQQLVDSFSVHPSDIHALAVDVAGRLWSACRDRSIRVIDLDARRVVARLLLERAPRFLAPLPDDAGVVVGDLAGHVSRFDYFVPREGQP